MSVTEQHLGPGRWSMRLSVGTPTSITDAIKYFGHIIITPQWFDPLIYDDAGMKSLSAYTGIVMSLETGDDGSYVLGGPSIAGWLGNRNSRGYIYERERFYEDDTLTNTLTRTASKPPGLLYRNLTNLISLTPGTITDPTSGTGLYTGSHIYQTPKEAIEYALGLWGQTHGYNMEYRVNPDGTIDIANRDNLFVIDTPKTLIHRGTGFSPEIRVEQASSLNADGDADDFATKVLLMASGYGFSQVAVASASQASYPTNVESSNFIGTNNIQKAMVSEPFTTEKKAEKRARKNLNQLNAIHKNIQMDTANYDITGDDYVVGDQVYVYDPQAGIFDTANEVYWEGSLIYPQILRVLSNSWGISEGMGVYYRSSAPTYTDLTRFVIWEEPGGKGAQAARKNKSQSIPVPEISF